MVACIGQSKQTIITEAIYGDMKRSEGIYIRGHEQHQRGTLLRKVEYTKGPLIILLPLALQDSLGLPHCPLHRISLSAPFQRENLQNDSTVQCWAFSLQSAHIKNPMKGRNLADDSETGYLTLFSKFVRFDLGGVLSL